MRTTANGVVALLAALLALVFTDPILAAPGHERDVGVIDQGVHGHEHAATDAEYASRPVMNPSGSHVHAPHVHEHRLQSTVNEDFLPAAGVHGGHDRVQCDFNGSSECESTCQACFGAISMDFLQLRVSLRIATHRPGNLTNNESRPADGQFRPPKPAQV